MSDWIENEVKGAKQFMQQLIQANTAIRAENEKLRAALKPFADMLTSEQMQGLIGVKDSDWTRAIVTMGDLRAAAAALKETGDE